MDGLRYSPDDPYYRLRPICDWDLFLGPLEWVRAETGGADRWVLYQRGFPGVARVNKVTPVSLGYPLSVFNKANSTLKDPYYRFGPVSAYKAESVTQRFIRRTLVTVTPRTCTRCSFRKFRVPDGGPDQLNRCMEAAAGSLLTCRSSCSFISQYNTMGVLPP